MPSQPTHIMDSKMKNRVDQKTRMLFFGFFLFYLIFANHSTAQWSTDPGQNNAVVVRIGDQSLPAIISDSRRGVIIAWTDGKNGDSDIYAQRIIEAGKSVWAANGSALETAIEDQEAPALVSLGSDGFAAAWQDERRDGSRREIFVQRFNLDSNAQWPIATLAHQINNLSPAIFLNNSGEIITASYFNSGFNDLIGVQFIDSDGQPRFDPQEIVNETAKGLQPNRRPAVVPALGGGVIAAWLDARNDTSVYVSGLLAARTPWANGEFLIGASAKPGTSPVIVSDDSEGAIVAWIKRGAPGDAIVVARLDAAGSLVWGVAPLEVNTVSGTMQNVAMAPDGEGGAYLAWENDLQVYIQRVTNDGEAWPADVMLATGSARQATPVATTNDFGWAIVAWVDARNDNQDIFAQAVDRAGQLLWDASGVAVSTAQNSQKNPVLMGDGLGGAIIAWEDLRNGDDSDIYAQRVNVNGGLGEFRTTALLSPGATDNWEIGSVQTIRWVASPELDSVNIELSRDGGQQFETLFAALPNLNPDGNEVTLDSVTGPASDQCVIRVTASEAPFINTVGEPFIISEAAGPQIQSAAVTQASFGDPLSIMAVSVDVSGVQGVLVNYRMGGASAFQIDEMVAVAADTFRGDIPSAFITERGVEYFVSAIDSLGGTSAKDTIFVTVNFEAGVQTRPVQESIDQGSYRMVSSPNLLRQPLADSIFAASGYSPYDTTSWRLFSFRDSVNVERDSLTAATFTFEPGHAYWHISASNHTVDFGAGVSIRADSSFSVSLAPGWNQVGNPFAFEVGWKDIQAASGFPLASDPVTFQGTYLPAQALAPYQGYFIFNFEEQDRILTFPPREFQQDSVSLAKVAMEAAWQVQIKAACGRARDNINFIGIDSRASLEWDRLDQPEPPPIGDFISVYFPHDNWTKFAAHYTTDFRPGLEDGQSWDLEIRTNVSKEPVLLEFSGIESVPATLEILLVDEKLHVVRNLREDSGFEFTPGKAGAGKRFKLVVAHADALPGLVDIADLIPTTFELSQNFPNPFNPSTSIRFGLPQAERVTIRVFDLLGREVTTLVNARQYEPGYHVAIWNGRERGGRPVASGVYIYRIKAGEFSQTRKMLLVK
ncbi:MAG: T9SS type A sorting domain-containing protein [Caldithrix sp.]|nr:MAG: T9SS type A sorting domain-containing protein [Caldithrix sp.]